MAIMGTTQNSLDHCWAVSTRIGNRRAEEGTKRVALGIDGLTGLCPRVIHLGSRAAIGTILVSRAAQNGVEIRGKA